MRLLAAALLLVAPFGAAFYLPGLAPVSFCEEGEETESCKVRALTGGPEAGRPLALLRSGLPRRVGSAGYFQSRRISRLHVFPVPVSSRGRQPLLREHRHLQLVFPFPAELSSQRWEDP